MTSDTLTGFVALLVAERDKINRAIEALNGETKRRGRPPGSKNKKRRKKGTQ